MAITKIWPVKSHLTELLKYVSNKSKTEAEMATVDPTILALIGYSEDEYKTEKRLYVTGVNCTVENAPQTMSTLLRRNDNHSDRVAYHAVQSFDGNECDPATAHAIGVAYAQEMWGENFAVIVATHQNTFHVHNHFAICATSYDGRRFHADGAMRHRMMEVNDRLCREHGLSVCENRAWGHKRRFVEKKMKERGQKSYREQLRNDIDQVIYEVGKETYRMEYFFERLENIGYIVEKRGRYWRVRPDEANRFIRFDSLGENYTEEKIRKRMAGQFYANLEPPRQFVYKKRERATGLCGLYLHYQYLLGNLPKTHVNDPSAYATLREDAKKMQRYSDEADMLGRNKIVSVTDLQQYANTQSDRLKTLLQSRQKLRNKLRCMHDGDEMKPIKDEIHALTKEIKKVRYQLELAKDVAERSEVVLYISLTFEYEQECAKDRSYADKHAAPRYPQRATKWLEHREELDRMAQEDHERIEKEAKIQQKVRSPYAIKKEEWAR